ncbi:MAG: hypothetical protein ACRDG6_13585 [Candidatus Limnocylindria bacterium]
MIGRRLPVHADEKLDVELDSDLLARLAPPGLFGGFALLAAPAGICQSSSP